MFYIYTAILLFCAYKFLFPKASNLVKNIFLTLGSVLFSLFTVEVFLSVLGVNQTEIEQVSGGYVSPYEILIKKNPYHIWPAGKDHWLAGDGFRYLRHVNSLGFTDPEWRLKKNSKEIRILALGDSFTEGDGAPYDSNYVALMEKLLSSSGDPTYLMNAGTCGSDPFFNFVNLRDRLLTYKPDIVIQSIGSGDMDQDILTRGGMERFQKEKLSSSRWESIYAINYVSRLFFSLAGYNPLTIKQAIPENEKRTINTKTAALFRDYSALCLKNNIKLFVVLHPVEREVENNNYNYDFAPLIKSMSADKNIQVIDLLPYYRAYIASAHNKAADYYWMHNGHHNSKGYEMMAETTLQNIAPYLHDTIPQSK
jgi:lysophospholipase L1-like esterase